MSGTGDIGAVDIEPLLPTYVPIHIRCRRTTYAFRMSRSHALERGFEFFCDLLGMNRDYYVFIFQDRIVQPTETVETVSCLSCMLLPRRRRQF
jgi:hypothetical protein